MATSFDKFKKPSTEEWWNEIKKSVKDPNDVKLFIQSKAQGVSVNAFYREQDLSSLELCRPIWPAAPARVIQPIYTQQIMAAQQESLRALENGADSLLYLGSDVPTEREWEALFKDIHLDWFDPQFDFGESNSAILYQLIHHFTSQSIDTSAIQGAIYFDPIRDAFLTGNFDYSEDAAFEVLMTNFNYAMRDLPGYRTVHVCTAPLIDAGADAVLETSCALAHTVEYLHRFTEKGITVDDIIQRMQLNTGIGDDYFTEIAKFRALRVLLDRITQSYRSNKKLYMHTHASMRNKTIYDAHSNLLRNTSEVMSVMMGGCDALSLYPFDVSFQLPSELSYRMSRNIPLILKHEASLNAVHDPAAGSYYIETLTQKIMDASWTMFLQIEEQGGYIAALKKRWVQDHIEKTAKAETSAFTEGKKILVGTNKYVNKQERKIGEISTPASSHFKKEEIVISPIRPQRLSESLDDSRMRLEETEKSKLN